MSDLQVCVFENNSQLYLQKVIIPDDFTTDVWLFVQI